MLSSLGLKALGLWAQLRYSHYRTQAWGSRLVAAYLYQPYEWFLNRHSADLATSILSEVDNVVNQALVPAMQAIAQGTIAVLLLGMLVAVDPMLALSVGAVLGGSYSTISVWLRNRVRDLGEERRRAHRARFVVVQEAFGGIKDVKLGGLEQAVLDRFVVPSATRARVQITAGVISQLPGLVLQGLLFGGVMVLLLFLVGKAGNLQDALPVVSLYALAGYRLMPAIQRVFEEVGKLRSAETAVDSLLEDLSRAPLPDHFQPQPSADEPREGSVRLRRSLELQDVTYQYPGAEKAALDGVSLSIAATESIGLVGPTGSGKTTLVDVLLGLLAPHHGAVVVDGQPLATDASRRQWRRAIGYVPQQIFLSDDSIAANIAFGVPARRIDMAAVERAARMARLHDFVSTDLPEGYATRVGERGVRLSGGQRQRIGIARALYHDPDVLVLDEATSALDNLTELAVMDAVRSLSRRKTIIMIAHRLSTVRECDRIILLESGRISAYGTFDELFEKNEGFRQMAEIA
jgi:ABC-type multidrug transport system fused ATPase/permease subunit